MEDVSSPCQSSTSSHERILPPSMYDDDARSASPSTYEKKDLGFASSFHKEFVNLPQKSPETSPFSPFENKADKPKSLERETKRSSRDDSPNGSPKGSGSSKTDHSKAKRSRSHDRRSSWRSRSRSHSKSKRIRSPVRERHRSRSKDRLYDRERLVIDEQDLIYRS